MDRRAFLAALAATSGCSALEGLDDPGGPTATPTGTATDTPMGTPTRRPTASPTQSPTESPTDTPADSPTATESETPTEEPTDTPTEEPTEEPTPEPTPEGDPVTADFIQAAIADLEDALTTFGDFGDGSLTSVTAATASFEWAPVVDRVADAERDLNEADGARPTPRQQERIDALRDVAQFVRLAARTQERLLECFAVVPDARAELYAERFGVADNRRRDLIERRAAAAEKRDELTAETDRANTDAMDALSRGTYDAKVAQFGAELDAFAAFDAPFKRLIAGLSAFAEGVGTFLDERWTPARDHFSAAATAAADARDGFQKDATPAEFAALVKEFQSVAAVIGAASEDLTASADAYRTGDDGTGRERLDDGQADLRDSDLLVEEVASVADILDA